ncbi:glycogen debranching protein [Cryptosporidium andersoni]|uniref:Glycogen debranching protein n=1 Tax=Cryptosporidium andersoni TaxID=117008 RepID=A0A1J4MRG3_9CRYT|nr:glycogen debranching protein [Cryptosporidium andersoni]
MLKSLNFRNQTKSDSNNIRSGNSSRSETLPAKAVIPDISPPNTSEGNTTTHTSPNTSSEKNDHINNQEIQVSNKTTTEIHTKKEIPNLLLDNINSKNIWFSEFDNLSRLSFAGSVGNIRVLCNDCLIIILYNGRIEGNKFQLYVENFHGDIELVDPFNIDELGNYYWSIVLKVPGSTNIKLKWNSMNGEPVENKICNNLIVEPQLFINKKFIPSSGICMQTVLSQCLGNITEWKRRLEIISKLNYNMIHFTPLQVFGQSGSCYSLANQNEISSLFFQKCENNKESIEDNKLELSNEEKVSYLKEVIKELENDFGILSTCDIVLNHTADNSPWLIDHPECGYNLENSPHLTAAVDLDNRLQEFSKNILEGMYMNKYGISENINSSNDVDRVIHALNEEVLRKFNINEYFTLDIEGIINQYKVNDDDMTDLFNRVMEKNGINSSSIEDKLYEFALHLSCTERGKMIIIPGSILNKLSLCNSNDLRNKLHIVQSRLYNFADDIIKTISNSVRGLVMWERVQCKKGSLGYNHWEALTPRYFTPIVDSSGKLQYMANNGWVMGWNVLQDFAASGSFVYLRRDLFVWSDCVKLRYGKNEEDVPFLWKWMSDYCTTVASIFHGIRLDNCHSTPPHVAKYMLRKSRKVRPNLWVYAELFTGNFDVDLEFERQLGLNALIREAMRANDPGSLGYLVSTYSSNGIGGLMCIPSLYQTIDLNNNTGEVNVELPQLKGVQPLVRRPCPALFFDCTHDNETPSEIRTPVDTLPTAALVASAACALGSTRGFDELVPHNISVVSERRLYQNYIANISEKVREERGRTETDNNNSQLNLRSRSNSLGPFQRLGSGLVTDNSIICRTSGDLSGTYSDFVADIIIEWKYNGNNVEIRGDWDNWKNSISLEKQQDGHFSTKILVKFGNSSESTSNTNNKDNIIYPQSNKLQYEYKYIVDGNWVHDPNIPYTMDKNGNINNIISLLKRQKSLALATKWKSGDKLPGIMEARKILNKVHYNMATSGFNETHVHYLTSDILMIQRYNPNIQENIYFITHSSFTYDKPNNIPINITLDGKIKETLFVGTLVVPTYFFAAYRNDPNRIHGLDSDLILYSKLEDIANVCYNENLHETSINLHNFPSGSLIILHTIRHTGVSIAKNAFKEFYDNIAIKLPIIIENCLKQCNTSDAINYIMYSCSSEELDRTKSRSVYNVPNYGDMPYCGIYSCISIFDNIRMNDDGGKSHPFIIHLKQGSWYIDYTINRLREYKAFNNKQYHKCDRNKGGEMTEICEDMGTFPLIELANWIHFQYTLLQKTAKIPIDYLITYIDQIFSAIYRCIMYYILFGNTNGNITSAEMSNKFIMTDIFYMRIKAATYQFYSYVPSAPLIWGTKLPSLCAGLPHFSTGFMRNWGRDTFISINGILLFTNRSMEAKCEILGYARLMKNGLIPNLLDSGNRPRYNARDATWFFIGAIVDYCKNVEDGCSILEEVVNLKSPINVSSLQKEKDAFKWILQDCTSDEIKSLKLCDIIQYILTRHVLGISFREENAGKEIDEQMKDEGFNISITWDSSNGLFYGGNKHNCGTWMDKMGSSEKAGNKGIPATPRDGANIELVALLFNTLQFLSQIKNSKEYPYTGVYIKNIENSNSFSFLSYSDWITKIKSNFEYSFYIPPRDRLNDKYDIDTKLINRVSIYKDTHRSSSGWADYQLRPNFSIAIGIAPELFTTEHALSALKIVEEQLLSPNMLGIKTLDPSDYNYYPNYDNSNDSTDFHIAHGFNYHQGPEWVWPLGYFLKAKYMMMLAAAKSEQNFNLESHKTKALYETMKFLNNHREYIAKSPWGSLPELTNDNGNYCKDSCTAQAWSIGTIFEFLSYVFKQNKK